MDRDAVIDTLRQAAPELRALGVKHASLFGSRARGDQGDGSDTDILIELDPAVRIGVYDYVAIKARVADLLPGPVDVVNTEALKPGVKASALRDKLDAF